MASYQKAQIQAIQDITHNTKLLHFILPPGDAARIAVGQHVRIKTLVGGSKIGIKPYTPISEESVTDSFDLLIKVYPDGFVSKSIGEAKVGDVISFTISNVDFNYEKTVDSMQHVGMIAGGKNLHTEYKLCNGSMVLPNKMMIHCKS